MAGFELEIINPLRYPGWDELLLRQRNYSFFHSAPWARVLSESYRYRPLYFTRMDKGKLSVLVPVMEVRSMLTGTRGVALPFTDYCQPILEREGYPDVMRQLITYGKAAEWGSIEIRTDNDISHGFPKSSSYFIHTLDLKPGPDALFRNFRDATRRNIKKSFREGVTVALHRTPESVAAFYRLNCETRKKHGLPPQPYCFFKKIYEHILARSLGFVVIAVHRGREIAGALCFCSREKIIFKYGASLQSGRRVRANNLVMWKAIQWSSENGFSQFCFGRTDLHHAGLRRFKAGWGGDETMINYYKYDLRKNAFVENHSWQNGVPAVLWKHIPIPVSKIAGKMLYRHVG